MPKSKPAVSGSHHLRACTEFRVSVTAKLLTCSATDRDEHKRKSKACTLDGGIPDSIAYPTSCSALIAQARMSSIGNVLFSEIISSSTQTQTLLDPRVSRSIDNQLKAWKLSLPSYFKAQSGPEWFRGPRSIVLWKEENIRLLLWWGSKRMCTSASDYEEAQSMCNFIAVETIQDISNFCRDNSEILHTGVSWYATYYVFQAAVVLSIYHLRPTESMNRGLDEEWLISSDPGGQGLNYAQPSSLLPNLANGLTSRLNYCIGSVDLRLPESMWSQGADTHDIMSFIGQEWGRRNILLLGATWMAISQLIVGTIYAVYRCRWETNFSARRAAADFIWVYIANFSYSIVDQLLVALITPRILESITFGTSLLGILRDPHRVGDVLRPRN
ncbi:hypothetical protein PENANT_c011G11825 [Penicillium antarcticum]|uniref:Uncharacterized protein n=1 Tax=Penicillium antarcticum TaxID=416450 RepID=A0A1V6Q6V9_9EURO|nr:hypothetical protein PENANT_c011G11825 [Penicillium antarcticum]